MSTEGTEVSHDQMTQNVADMQVKYSYNFFPLTLIQQLIVLHNDLK